MSAVWRESGFYSYDPLSKLALSYRLFLLSSQNYVGHTMARPPTHTPPHHQPTTAHTLSLTHSHTHTHFPFLTHRQTLSLSLCLSLSHTHTHTHTHTQTYKHTHTHTRSSTHR